MALSRSSWEYLARAGLLPSTQRPAPRLSSELLVSLLPVEQPTPAIVRLQAGSPEPDRVHAVPWPNTPEAKSD